MPDMYGGDHRHTVEHGIRCVKLDAVTVLTTMGMATDKLGLGATYSTTYFPPFHIARVFATLDHMTGGRAAWNVVTSVNDNEGEIWVCPKPPLMTSATTRLTNMEVVHGHWDTWEADAVVVDRETGVYAIGDKVHRLTTTGITTALEAHSRYRELLKVTQSSSRLAKAVAGLSSRPGGANCYSCLIPTSHVQGRTTRRLKQP